MSIPKWCHLFLTVSFYGSVHAFARVLDVEPISRTLRVSRPGDVTLSSCPTWWRRRPRVLCRQVTMGITTLLSMTVFLMLVTESMPPTSNVLPLIGQLRHVSSAERLAVSRLITRRYCCCANFFNKNKIIKKDLFQMQIVHTICIQWLHNKHILYNMLPSCPRLCRLCPR